MMEKELGFEQMKIFKELNKLGYIHYSATTIEELDDLPLNSAERISEQALVLRWFREKHSLRFSIIDDHSENEKPYSFTSEHEYYYDTGSGNNWFKTYEEAELACLVKLIEIVKEK